MATSLNNSSMSRVFWTTVISVAITDIIVNDLTVSAFCGSVVKTIVTVAIIVEILNMPLLVLDPILTLTTNQRVRTMSAVFLEKISLLVEDYLITIRETAISLTIMNLLRIFA